MLPQAIRFDAPFELESGATLPAIEIAYATAGQLNEAGDNAVWVCHALTGDAHADLWWPGLIGPGAVIDTDRYFVVCANMLGSCYGSTGPLSVNPTTDKPYYHGFPSVTTRDMVRAHDLLRTHLGVRQIRLAVGGSMGGQQVLRWAVDQPGLFAAIAPVACNARHSPWGIAFNEAQRMAIDADPSWTESRPDAGAAGLRAARAIGMLSYRHYDIFARSQAEEEPRPLGDFRAASYLRYQGKKLEKRFNAFSYWRLSEAMDSHDVGRGHGGMAAALGRVKARAVAIGVSSDLLFPPDEQRLIASYLPNGRYHQVESSHGHDGFLVEIKEIGATLHEILRD